MAVYYYAFERIKYVFVCTYCLTHVFMDLIYMYVFKSCIVAVVGVWLGWLENWAYVILKVTM